MRLFTSNFAKSAGNPKAISIANYPAKWYKGRAFKQLAPPWWLIKAKLPRAEFTEKYIETVLSKFDPVKIAEQFGEGAVMLCWEKATDFCHRQVVAAWMRGAEIDVEEHDRDPDGKARRDADGVTPKSGRGFPVNKTKKAPEVDTTGFTEPMWKAFEYYKIYRTYPAKHAQAQKILNQLREFTDRLSPEHKALLSERLNFDF